MIKQKVRHLIKKHGTNNPFVIASQKNIMVLFERLGSTLGYFHTFKRIRIIHINNELNKHMQHYVCAHELGHAVLHQNVNTPFLKKNTFFSIDKIEIEANTFAVELLLPDEIIYEYKNTNLTIEEISSIYGIPREVARLKKV